MKPADVRFEIHAQRNALARSEVRNLIDTAQFETLAQQMVNDRQKTPIFTPTMLADKQAIARPLGELK